MNLNYNLEFSDGIDNTSAKSKFENHKQNQDKTYSYDVKILTYDYNPDMKKKLLLNILKKVWS